MTIYFFIGAYDLQKVGKTLEELGLHKKQGSSYELGDFGFVVNCTDSSQGILQLTGSYVKDVYDKGNTSEHYSMLEKLAKNLHPNKIVNDAFRNKFPELVEK